MTEPMTDDDIPDEPSDRPDPAIEVQALRTIHDRSGREVAFNAGEQTGIDVGGVGAGNPVPSLDIVLTEHVVYIVHQDTRDILDQVSIDHEYAEMGEDDHGLGPIAPKEGAVDTAIAAARDVANGFITGWRHRHDQGGLDE